MAKKQTTRRANGTGKRKLGSGQEVVETIVEGKILKVPTGVIDIDAYNEYNRVLNSETLKNCEVETSDPNCTVNLKSLLFRLEAKIAHLPEEEREELKARGKAMHSLMGKLSQLKKKAFGIAQNGPYSLQESVLDAKSSELIEYFGRFHSAYEIHKIVTIDWGYDVNYTTVENFRKRHLDRIKEKQEEYKRDYSDVRLGHKRSRLDELQYLYNHRKQKYEESENKDDYKLLLQTIEQIRKEVEGDKFTIDGHLTMDVEHTVNLHIQNEVLKNIVINDIIVGRLSARIGVDSRVLINKLHNSYYAKFTGFDTSQADSLDEVPIYPSKFVYNFDDLERHSLELKNKEEDFKRSLPVLEPAQKAHMTDVKSILLEKIRNKKAQINESQQRVDDIDDAKIVE